MTRRTLLTSRINGCHRVNSSKVIIISHREFYRRNFSMSTFGLCFSVIVGLSVLLSCAKSTMASPVPSKLMRVLRDVDSSSHSTTFKASTQRFAEDLTSPCKSHLPNNPTGLPIQGITPIYLVNKTITVRHYVNKAVELWNECQTTNYRQDLTPPMPTHENLLSMQYGTAIQTIYEILVIHTSHIYHMYHQQNASTERCNDRPQDHIAAGLFNYIFVHMQDLMCDIKISHPNVSLEQATTNGLERAELTTDSRCSTRVHRDCLVGKSFQKVLDPLIRFLEGHSQRQAELSKSSNR